MQLGRKRQRKTTPTTSNETPSLYWWIKISISCILYASLMMDLENNTFIKRECVNRKERGRRRGREVEVPRA
jgi:hypothetical protein